MVQRRLLGERALDESRQVDGTQITGAIRWQGYFAAGVRGGDSLAVVEVVQAIDTIDEQDAGLGRFVYRIHQARPELPRAHSSEHPAGRVRTVARPVNALHLVAIVIALRHGETQRPLRVISDRLHEIVGHLNRQIEVRQNALLSLGADESLDIGMVAAQRPHHRSPPGAR